MPMLYYIHMNRLELAWPRRAHGFTIIEVIVVIVVIAILTTMTVVGYSWVTRDAKDSARRAAVSDLTKALHAFSVRKGKIGGLGTGSGGGLQSNGFCPTVLNGGGGWAYPRAYGTTGCSVGDMLVAAEMIPSDFWERIPAKPGNANGNSSQLIYGCGDIAALFYYVDNPTSEETETINSLVTICPTNRVNTLRSNYNVNAAVIIEGIRS